MPGENPLKRFLGSRLSLGTSCDQILGKQALERN